MLPNLPPSHPAADPSAPLDADAAAARKVLAELATSSRSPERALNATALRLMHEYLTDRDEPCPTCRYNLRNLRGDACPECGWKLRLRVSAIEPPLTPWVITVVLLCVGAGLGIPSVIFIGMGALSDMFRRADGIEYFIGFALVFFALCIPASIIALLNRRRFLRWKPASQIITAVIACGAVSLTIIIVLAIMFGGPF